MRLFAGPHPPTTSGSVHVSWCFPILGITLPFLHNWICKINFNFFSKKHTSTNKTLITWIEWLQNARFFFYLYQITIISEYDARTGSFRPWVESPVGRFAVGRFALGYVARGSFHPYLVGWFALFSFKHWLVPGHVWTYIRLSGLSFDNFGWVPLSVLGTGMHRWLLI